MKRLFRSTVVVKYLLPVLLALSGGDRRRQREVEAGRHLLECDLCARLSRPLMERSPPRDDELCISIRADADIVTARQAARELASRLGFSRTELTLIATAVSEVARNIVRFAGVGQIAVELLDRPRRGVQIVARDTGPGIFDVEQALSDGYSTYHGLGLAGGDDVRIRVNGDHHLVVALLSAFHQ